MISPYWLVLCPQNFLVKSHEIPDFSGWSEHIYPSKALILHGSIAIFHGETTIVPS